MSLGFALSPLAVAMAAPLFLSGGFEPGITGEGTLVDAPVPFWGTVYADTTGVLINSLTMKVDDQYSPCLLCFNLDVVISGVRTRTGLPIRSNHVHIEWVLEYADGTPIETYVEDVNPNNNEPRNIYNDIKLHAYTIPFFEYGDFKATAKVYGYTAAGKAVMNEETIYFSRGRKSSMTYINWDATNGNNADDGRARVKQNNTSATYSHATGIINEPGAFTGLALDDLTTTAWYESHNILKFDGFDQVLVEPIDNDNVRVVDDWRDVFGSDQSGLTSTSGPKQTFTSLDFSPNADRFYGFCGDNNDVYEMTASHDIRNKTGQFGYGGYGAGQPKYIPASSVTFASTFNMFNFNQTPSSTDMPDNFFINNFTIDGDLKCTPIGGAMVQPGDVGRTSFVERNVKYTNSASPTCWALNKHKDKELNIGSHHVHIDNRRKINIAATVTSDVLVDAKVITINADLTPLFNGGTLCINGYNYTFSNSGAVDNGDGTWTVTLEGQRYPDAFVSDLAAGAALTVHERRNNCRFFAATRHGLVGDTYQGYSDKNAKTGTFMHCVYNSLYGDNSMVAWCTDTADSHFGHMFNLNNDRSNSGLSPVIDRFSWFENQCIGSNWFLEGSNDLNELETDQITGMCAAGNAGSPNHGAFYFCIITDYMCLLNNFVFDPVQSGNTHAGGGAFFALLNMAEAEALTQQADFVVERNVGYGIKAWDDNLSNIARYLEFGGNTFTVTEPNDTIINIHTANALGLSFHDNNLITLGGNATPFRVDDTNYDIDGFNALSIADSNLDYDPASPPVYTGTFNPPDGETLIAYSYDASVLFTGNITSYSLTGTLPDGLSFDTNAGVISGTPTTAQTLSGISVTATNAFGSDTTDSADIAVTELQAPVYTGTFNPPDAYIGSTYNYDVSALFTGGGTFSVSAGVLPDGLSLDSQTGIISGDPTTVEIQSGIVITVTNPAGTDSTDAADIGVTQPPQVLTFDGSNYMTVAQFPIFNGESIEIDYSTGASNGHFITTTSGNDIGLRFVSKKWYFIGSLVVDGVSVAVGENVFRDGNPYTAVITSNVGYTLSVDTFMSGLSGQVTRIKVTKSAGITEWFIDNGSTTTISPTTDENGLGDLTLVNVTAANWS